MYLPDPTVVSRRARKEQAQEIARLARMLRGLLRREIRAARQELRQIWRRPKKTAAITSRGPAARQLRQTH